jgi:hypothetical protein
MKTPREILLKHHQTVEPKLERMWDESLSPTVAAVCDRRKSRHEREIGAPRAPLQLFAWKLWRELVLPSRRVWAGLACAWVLIAVLNLASAEPATRIVSQVKPPSGEELRALIEQRRMLSQLIGPLSEPVYPRKRVVPGPRSERAAQTTVA